MLRSQQDDRSASTEWRDVAVEPGIDHGRLERIAVWLGRNQASGRIIDIVQPDFMSETTDTALGPDALARVHVEVNAVADAGVFAFPQAAAFCTAQAGAVIAAV